MPSGPWPRRAAPVSRATVTTAAAPTVLSIGTSLARQHRANVIASKRFRCSPWTRKRRSRFGRHAKASRARKVFLCELYDARLERTVKVRSSTLQLEPSRNGAQAYRGTDTEAKNLLTALVHQLALTRTTALPILAELGLAGGERNSSSSPPLAPLCSRGMMAG